MTENECNCPVCRSDRTESFETDPSEITIDIPSRWFSSLPKGKVRNEARETVFSHIRSFYPNATITSTRRKANTVPTECLMFEIDRLIDNACDAWSERMEK